MFEILKIVFVENFENFKIFLNKENKHFQKNLLANFNLRYLRDYWELGDKI